MERSSIVIVATVVLLWLAYWLVKTQGFEWDKAITIISVIGTAAGLAALAETKRHARKASFTISDAFLKFREKVFMGYQLSATLINVSDEPDVLRQINFQFYNKHLGFIESVLTCGGRQVMQDKGHILPIECLQRKLCRVDGIGDIGVNMRIYERLALVEQVDDYVLRCTFVFATAKPITIRVSRNGLIQMWPPLLTAQELLLRLKSLSRNPFTYGHTT